MRLPGLTIRRLLAVLLSVFAVAAVSVAAPASAGADPGHSPSRIALPDGFQPEGIEAGYGKTIYVGSLVDGSIWRGNVRTGKGAVWAEGPGEGSPAVGMVLDRRRHLLWVAGGPTGEVRAYDIRTAALVKTYTFAGSGFLNDVVVTRRGVYATDSFVQRLAVVEFGKGGSLPADGTTLPLTGDITYVAGPPDNPAFNANGIVAQHGWLVINQTETGQLFRVGPRTGVARELRTFGTDLVGADGMELRGHLLYVVRGSVNTVNRMVLLTRHRLAVPAGTLEGDLDFPATAALVGRHLYVVNARFTTTPTPTTEYWVTRL